MRSLLRELKLESWLKTSGGKGLHVVVPIAPRWSYDNVKELSKAVVVHLAKTIPSRFVSKSGAANRVGKLFVDYLRNGHSATTAAAFSARARPGLGVSMPIDWEDLPKVKSGSQWTIANAREYLFLPEARSLVPLLEKSPVIDRGDGCSLLVGDWLQRNAHRASSRMGLLCSIVRRQ